MDDDVDAATESFDCPRCGSPAVERLWGPCRSCREQLVQTQRADAVEVEPGRFEPAMHVVPNQVATRD